MYTGKLEYPTTMQQKLYEAADKLGLTVLTKLLKDPSKNNTDSPKSIPGEETNLKSKLQLYEKSLDYTGSYDAQVCFFIHYLEFFQLKYYSLIE